MRPALKSSKRSASRKSGRKAKAVVLNSAPPEDRDFYRGGGDMNRRDVCIFIGLIVLIAAFFFFFVR